MATVDPTHLPPFRRVAIYVAAAALALIPLLEVVIPDPVARAVVRNLVILVSMAFAFGCALYAYRHLIGRDRRIWAFITLSLAAFTASYTVRMIGFWRLGSFMKSPSPDDIFNFIALAMLIIVAGLIGDPVRARATIRVGRTLNYAVLVVIAYVMLFLLVIGPLRIVPADHFTLRGLAFSLYITVPIAVAMYPIIFRDERWTEWVLMYEASLVFGATYTTLMVWLIGSGVFGDYRPIATWTDELFVLAVMMTALSAAWRTTQDSSGVPEALPPQRKVRWGELGLMALALVSTPVVVNAAVNAPEFTTWATAAIAAVIVIVLLIILSGLAVVEASRAGGPVDAAERYSSVVENSPGAVLVLGRRGVILYANASAARTLHAASPFDLVGADIGRLLPDRNSEEFEDLVGVGRRPAAESGHSPGAPVTRCLPMLTLDGETIMVERTTTAINFGDEPALLLQGNDVTARVEAEAEIAEYRDQLRGFADVLIRAEEEERRRIAKALEYQVSQPLEDARQSLKSAREDGLCTGDDASVALQMIERGISQTSMLTSELAPHDLYELGLEAGIAAGTEQIGNAHGLTLAFSGHIDDSGLSDEVRTAVYRSVRELLMNVVQHAHVSRASIEFDGDDEWLQVTVGDRGVGFDVAAVEKNPSGSYGLFKIRERVEHFGGKLDVQSTAGEGVRAVILVPRGDASTE